MSKNHATIIHRFPNTTIPEQYLRTMLKVRPNAGGYAVQTLKDGKPELIVDHMDVGVELEAVQDLIKGYHDRHILLAFHQAEKFEESDLQPFRYVIDGGSPDLAFAIEGDFPTMIEGDVHPESKLNNTVIIPNLNKIRKFVTGDPEAFMKELDDPTFRDMISSRIGIRGYLCFFPPVGEPIWIEKAKFGSTFPWGKVSNTHGYEEKPETVTTTTDRPGWWNMGSKKSPKLPVAEAAPKAPPAPAPSPAPAEVPKPDTRVSPPEITPDPAAPYPPEGTKVDLGNGMAGEWKSIPTNMSRNDRKHFVKRVTHCGNNMPKDWASPDFRYLEVAYASNPKTLEALKDKLVEDQNMKQAAPTRGSEVVHEANTMILSAGEKSAAETTLLKMMDRQGKPIPSPIEIQKMETKYPTFSGTFGIKLEQTDHWLPEDVKNFAMENGKAFFHLFLEVRRAKMEAEAALAAVGKAHTEPAPTASVPEVKKTGTGGWGNWAKK